MLGKKDLKLLSVLGRRPLATIRELSMETNMSPRTVSKRLKMLTDAKILLSVSAQLCYYAIGLEPVVVFLKSDFKHLSVLEKVLDNHPYTRYRVRCLGAVNGIYGLFAIPNGTLPLLIELFDELLKRKLLAEYQYYTPIARFSYSEHDFSVYDPEAGVWRFNWEGWEKHLEETPPPLKEKPPSILHKLDEKDMRILRQLTINAREKNRKIAKLANVPPYHLSRRLKFYAENSVIDGYRVIVGIPLSRLFDMYMFYCRCSIDVTKKFAEACSKLPFQSTYIPIREGFFLQVSIPPLELPNLVDILQKNCENVSLIWSDYTTSMRYWFYPEISVKGRWIASREAMLDEVLKKL